MREARSAQLTQLAPNSSPFQPLSAVPLLPIPKIVVFDAIR
jgi:hypothetical protein